MEVLYIDRSQYASLVAVDRDLVDRVAAREKRVEAMTPEARIAAASILHDAKERLGSHRQRELADEIAADFEARATAKARAASS